ncbi:MAG: ATP phosphoribosyltransferase regulatory subunit [Christensenellaceae bacterium]|nr:ATP phosphoribosyltransferase regulatory subunit [Christensenellaceae bacterium]
MYDRISPEGTRDYIYEELEACNQAAERLRGLFAKSGFTEVKTPSLEFFDVFASGKGKLAQNEMYTVTDGHGRLLVMRPDSVKPVARLVASRFSDLGETPLRLFYEQPVFRRRAKLSKQSDEIYQCGAELINSGNAKGDREIVLLALKSMSKLFGNGFVLSVGHSELLNDIFKLFSDKYRGEIKTAVGDSRIADALAYALKDESAAKNGEFYKFLFSLKSGTIEALDAVKSVLGETRAIKKLTALLDVAEKARFKDNVAIDLLSVNKYDYYTGIILKGYVDGAGGAVLSGGRYDTLYQDYNLPYSAAGFAVNLNAAAKNLI